MQSQYVIQSMHSQQITVAESESSMIEGEKVIKKNWKISKVLSNSIILLNSLKMAIVLMQLKPHSLLRVSKGAGGHTCHPDFFLFFPIDSPGQDYRITELKEALGVTEQVLTSFLRLTLDE